MNIVNLCGKIIRINHGRNVAFVTLHTKDGRHSEYIDVTVFDSERFFDRYFIEGNWIAIQGRIHIEGKERNYKYTVIAEQIYFAGDRMDLEPELKEVKEEECPF